jgi:hypothetical protein
MLKDSKNRIQQEQEKNRRQVLDYVDSLDPGEDSGPKEVETDDEEKSSTERVASSLSGLKSSSEKKSSTSTAESEQGGDNETKGSQTLSTSSDASSDKSGGEEELAVSLSEDAALDTTSLERQTNYNVVGAVRVQGVSSDADVSRQENEIPHNTDIPLKVHATLVEDESTITHRDLESATVTVSSIPTVKAEQVQVSKKKNWKLYAVIAVLLLIVVGMAIGIPLALKNDDNDDDDVWAGSSEDI